MCKLKECASTWQHTMAEEADKRKLTLINKYKQELGMGGSPPLQTSMVVGTGPVADDVGNPILSPAKKRCLQKSQDESQEN